MYYWRRKTLLVQSRESCPCRLESRDTNERTIQLDHEIYSWLNIRQMPFEFEMRLCLQIRFCENRCCAVNFGREGSEIRAGLVSAGRAVQLSCQPPTQNRERKKTRETDGRCLFAISGYQDMGIGSRSLR